MIYELRTYTMQPGKAQVHAENAGTIGLAIMAGAFAVLALVEWLLRRRRAVDGRS